MKKSREVNKDMLPVRTLRQTVLIPASPEEVYRVFVHGPTHAAVTGSGAQCTARVGGRFSAWDGYIAGKNLVLEQGRRVVQEWLTTEWPAGYAASRFEVLLEPRGTQTKLTMIHTGVPAAQAASYAEGWRQYYWQPMKRYFTARRCAATPPRSPRRPR